MARRLVEQQLSGIGIATVWDILVAACKEIALYYGGAVVTGAALGGAIGSAAFGVGAIPGAVIGTAAGVQVGTWVMALIGLKELTEGLANMLPAALDHYERGFREAWGAAPEDRRDTWTSTAPASGNSYTGAWHMAQGHAIMMAAILTALVAYLTRGRGNKTVLMHEIRQSAKLGPKFADWVIENEGKLLGHPHLQTRSRAQSGVAMPVAPPINGHVAPPPKSSYKPVAGKVNKVVMNSGGDRLIGKMGPARTNNTAEFEAIVNDLKAKGVDISYRQGQFAYGPAPSGGRPGNIVFDPDSSLSAIKHEYGHFLDDAALGFPGQRYYYENPGARVATERRQYLGEIRTARELGDPTARRQLIEDYLDEKKYLIDNYYSKPYGSN
jgi:hypothetical protein